MTNITLKRRLLARWKIIIAIIVLLGIGSYFSHTIVSASLHNYQLMQRGNTTSGHIIDVWEDYEPAERGAGFWHYTVTYTYQLPDGREFTGQVDGEGRLKPNFRSLIQPYPIEVTYLPDNPAISCISADLPDNILGAFRHSPGSYFMAALFLLLGFYLLKVLISEERIQKKEGKLAEQRQREFDELTKEIIERSRKPS